MPPAASRAGTSQRDVPTKVSVQRAGVRATLSLTEGLLQSMASHLRKVCSTRWLFARHVFEAGRGQAAGDELAHQRNPALLEQHDGFGRVLADCRLGSIPIHQRQVVVPGVFAVLYQRGEDVPALVNGDALQRGGEVKADDGGFFFLGEASKFRIQVFSI